MSTIKKLKFSVSSKLQSQAFTLSFAKIVLELIRNSIDADATVLQILIDFQNLKCIVADNGTGMIPDDLVSCGKQYFTSKICDLNDLYDSSKYGFKGESVFHLSNISHLTAISKGQGYNSYWIKQFSDVENRRHNVKHYDINTTDKESWLLDLRKKWNTCFILTDILYNIPVRRDMILETPVFQHILQIKKELLPILIRYPTLQLGIKYKSDENFDWKSILNYSDRSIDTSKVIYPPLLRILFGPIIPMNMMKKMTIKFKEYSLTCILSRFPMKNKNLQFVIVNGRFYHDLNLFNSINNIFQDAVSEESNKLLYKSSNKQYPMFLLDIQAPKNIDDILKDPSKSVILPSNSSLIHDLALRVVKSFFRPETNKKRHTISVNDNDNTTTTFSTSSFMKPDLPVMERKIPEKFLVATKIKSSNNYLSHGFSTHDNTKVTSGKIKKSRNILKASSLIPRDKWELINSNLTTKNGSNRNITILTKSKVNNCWLDIKRLTENNDAFKLDNNMIELNITREQLSNCAVINQVDKKFILLSHETEKANSLFIMDQHTCDERIKLEQYLQQFVSNSINGTLFSQKLLDCAVTVNNEELNALKYYTNEFMHWGITYDTSQKNQIKILTIPDILSDQFTTNDKMFLRNAILQHVHDLSELKKIKVSSLNNERNNKPENGFIWWKYLNCIPNFFLDFFASKACRSAIMFGDSLNKNECIILIKSLIKCHLPFQCAHGRPSVIPLTIIQDKISETKDTLDNIPNDYQLN